MTSAAPRRIAVPTQSFPVSPPPITNMKLEKTVVDRRIRLMEEAGIKFICGADVGKDITGEELLKKYDRIILTCGASNPRDISVPGRDGKGIWFAVDFLKTVTLCPLLFSCTAAARPEGPLPITAIVFPVRTLGVSAFTRPFAKAYPLDGRSRN